MSRNVRPFDHWETVARRDQHENTLQDYARRLGNGEIHLRRFANDEVQVNTVWSNGDSEQKRVVSTLQGSVENPRSRLAGPITVTCSIGTSHCQHNVSGLPDKHVHQEFSDDRKGSSPNNMVTERQKHASCKTNCDRPWGNLRWRNENYGRIEIKQSEVRKRRLTEVWKDEDSHSVSSSPKKIEKGGKMSNTAAYGRLTAFVDRPEDRRTYSRSNVMQKHNARNVRAQNLNSFGEERIRKRVLLSSPPVPELRKYKRLRYDHHAPRYRVNDQEDDGNLYRKGDSRGRSSGYINRKPKRPSLNETFSPMPADTSDTLPGAATRLFKMDTLRGDQADLKRKTRSASLGYRQLLALTQSDEDERELCLTLISPTSGFAQLLSGEHIKPDQMKLLLELTARACKCSVQE